MRKTKLFVILASVILITVNPVKAYAVDEELPTSVLVEELDGGEQTDNADAPIPPTPPTMSTPNPSLDDSYQNDKNEEPESPVSTPFNGYKTGEWEYEPNADDEEYHYLDDLTDEERAKIAEFLIMESDPGLSYAIGYDKGYSKGYNKAFREGIIVLTILSLLELVTILRGIFRDKKGQRDGHEETRQPSTEGFDSNMLE